MPTSPRSSEGKARAIRELSRELSHSPRSISSPSQADHESNPTLYGRDFVTSTSLGLHSDNDDIIMSTRHLDDETTNALPTRPYIRSTAKKVGSWTMPNSEPPVDTSMVNKHHFSDFDKESSEDESVSISIEQARGGNRSNRSTPVRLNSSFVDFNSLYDMTPPTGRSRKSYAAETGSLRRDAQIRRASNKDVDKERKRNTLSQLHARVSEDDSMMSERPPTVSVKATTSRFSRSRQNSPQQEAPAATPQRASNSTPRPMTANNATAQSFMLPDLPNLTELVSGVFQDGTPVFSKTAPPRHKFATPGPMGGRQPNHVPVDSVPIPEEEKAIFASLQLLKEKVSQLENERAEAEKKIEEQELQIIELKAANRAQDKVRRSDSGLGSTDGEGSGERNNWKVEKTRLEASVETLRTRLDRAERKLSVSEIANKRITSERDNLVSQLSVAFYTSEELKSEKQALSTENDSLRQEVDSLRAENEALREQLEQEQDHFREETLQLKRRADRTEKAVHKENETLRTELTRLRTQHGETTQNMAKKEAELRRARKEKAEFTRLKAENEALQTQLANLKAARQDEVNRWAKREAELNRNLDHRDETIRLYENQTQDHSSDALRVDNEHLRAELAELEAQREEENQRWAQKEARLRRKVEKKEGAARQMEEMTRELLDLRHANAQQSAAVQASTSTGIQRQPSLRREDTRTRIANQVQQEVRNSRSVSATHAPVQRPLSPGKSRARAQKPQRASLPGDFARSASAPIANQQNYDSDAESTTDLSLAPKPSYAMNGDRTGQASHVEPPPDLDLTELSTMATENIASLRRMIEEERAIARNFTSAPVEQTEREDTARSVASVKSNRRPSLPRKSSLKDTTEKTQGTVFEDLTGRLTDNGHVAHDEPTDTNPVGDTSIVSNSSRRRRSIPVETTSAFIIPDLTLKFNTNSSKAIPLGTHDNDNCTVCRRKSANPAAEPLSIPKLLPVSDRMPSDVDATMRPSRSPKEALALVVKELEDEYSHLKLEWAAYNALLEAHDASLGRRKRVEVEAAIDELLKRMHVKADQIYHLYDVLEGQGDHELTEQDVEDLTREIRVEEENKTKGKGKKVTLDIGRDGARGRGGANLEDEEESLWEGFEDTNTASMHPGGQGRSSRRGGAY